MLSNETIVSESQVFDDMITKLTQHYLMKSVDNSNARVYQKVVGEVEKVFFDVVMRYTRGNQSLAARVTGLSRGTLRKKLEMHFGTTRVGKANRQVNSQVNEVVETV